MPESFKLSSFRTAAKIHAKGGGDTGLHIEAEKRDGNKGIPQLGGKRAGIEEIHFVLRRKYRVDQLLVRGLVRSSQKSKQLMYSGTSAPRL